MKLHKLLSVRQRLMRTFERIGGHALVLDNNDLVYATTTADVSTLPALIAEKTVRR